MSDFSLFNNYSDAICIFLNNKDIIFKNYIFLSVFSDFRSFDKFKKKFNFNLCFLSSDSITELTPIDILLKSNENFHTIASYQKSNGEFIYLYIYSFMYFNYRVVVFKDITTEDALSNLNKKYNELEAKYNDVKESTNKFYKLQEHAQIQVLKMGIINKISLVIRETNDMESILSSALDEIHNLLGSFKTYFSMREKNSFKIIYSVTDKTDINLFCEYEKDVMQNIRNKDIFVSSCLKEYINSDKFIPNGATRIIIPVYNKNRLLGIIVTFTKQKISIEDNREILQSISVQLASSIIQAGLITQLNKKNKKLQKTLNELKETQLQLINSEKMASLGQLVSGVAHEINTPLASINSNNNLIQKIISNNLSLTTEQINMIKELNNIDIEASNRISNIVKSLKRFVRLDEAEFQEADINKEIDLTINLIAHELKDRIKVIKKYSKLPPVYCSVNMLNQVFMNILVNACHSINQKNIEGKIEISTFTDEHNLIVKIKDNGSGIPFEIQNKIFDVGFTTKKIGVGTGLGLSISKKIIELHKGSISFNSSSESGTEFIVSIPMGGNK